MSEPYQQTHWFRDCPAWRMNRDDDREAITPDEVSCLTCITDMRQLGLLPRRADES